MPTFYNNKKSLMICFIIVFTCLLLSPLFDFLSVYGRYVGIGYLERSSLVLRAVLFVSVLFVIISTYNLSVKSFIRLFIIILPFTSLCINSLILGLGTTGDFLETIIIIIKLQSFFIFYYFFCFLLKSERSRQVAFFICDVIFVIYFLAIIIGALFNIEMLHNYKETERFGVKGIIIAGNEASSFLLVGLMWFLLRFDKQKFKIYFLALCIFAIIMSGTKASILGLFLIIFLYYIYRVGIVYGIVSFSFISGLFISTVCILYKYNNDIQTVANLTYSYFEYQYIENFNESIISVLLSGRDYKLLEVWNGFIINYPQTILTGGYLVSSYSVEMDIFDMLFLLGFPCLLIYYFFWLLCFLKGQSRIPVRLRVFEVGFILVWISLANLGGHFFYSAITAPFAGMLAFYFNTLNIENRRE